MSRFSDDIHYTPVTKVSPSMNREWGFYGTCRNARVGVRPAWRLACLTLIRQGFDREAARAYLDSTRGRHLADIVVGMVCTGRSLEDAVERAIGLARADEARRS